MVIRSVTALAWLADPGSEVTRAREKAQAGDEDWGLWLSEFERGHAMLIDMRVCVSVEQDGTVHEVAAENHQLWAHRTQHPPALAATVAELSSKDYNLLAERLRELGVPLTVRDLDDMYVTVELADDLIETLRPDSVRAAAPLDGGRPGTETQSY